MPHATWCLKPFCKSWPGRHMAVLVPYTYLLLTPLLLADLSPCNGLVVAANSGHLPPHALRTVPRVICLRRFAQTGRREVQHVPRASFPMGQLATVRAEDGVRKKLHMAVLHEAQFSVQPQGFDSGSRNTERHATIDRVLSNQSTRRWLSCCPLHVLGASAGSRTMQVHSGHHAVQNCTEGRLDASVCRRSALLRDAATRTVHVVDKRRVQTGPGSPGTRGPFPVAD
ncbi:hypothetical protein VTI74DRAFT_1192 [Chaetomium olivicolor]